MKTGKKTLPAIILMNLFWVLPVLEAKSGFPVRPDKNNVVANGLAGTWLADGKLAKSMGTRVYVSRAVFRFNPEVARRIPAKYARFLKKTRIYMAGEMELTLSRRKMRVVKHPFILIAHGGNPYVVYFRPRRGRPMGDAESFYVMLAKGKTAARDILFMGGDFPGESFFPLRRGEF